MYPKHLSGRFFDLVFTIPGLILLLPVFLIIALCIKLDSQGPVFFRQVRVGLHGQPFLILKFRTMIQDAERMGKQITVGNDARITRFGKILRRYKLDELPQLINILKNEMSLVGPRPEVPRYVSLYNEEMRKVLELMPGLTDPASIKYRNESEILSASSDPEQKYINEIMPEKICLNLEYARNASIMNNFKIILITLFHLPTGFSKVRNINKDYNA